MPYLWIDPPGEDPGWLHDFDGTEDARDRILSQYDIPADNTDRQAAHDRQAEADHAGPSADLVQRYQDGRDFWGVTVLAELPKNCPAEVISR